MTSGRFEAAIAAIDAANAVDPTTVTVDGVARPKELVHAERATAWVQRLDPDADEAQLLAARAHHLRRWVSPRSDEPPGRKGYLRWRHAAKKRHAEEVASLLEDAGYDGDTIARVQGIVRKEGLGTDDAVQTHEDALCLVFLELQLDALIDDLGTEKAVTVLAKTAAKMSPAALEAATALPLSPEGLAALRAALDADA